MKNWNVAVLGATGAVGQQMLKVLAERNIPLGTVKALASASSAGKKVYCGDREIIVEETCENSFEGMDFVLGAVSNAMAQKFRPAIVNSGAVFIDNSSAFRLDDDVPLVIPQINGDDAFRHKGVIANLASPRSPLQTSSDRCLLHQGLRPQRPKCILPR